MRATGLAAAVALFLAGQATAAPVYATSCIPFGCAPTDLGTTPGFAVFQQIWTPGAAIYGSPTQGGSLYEFEHYGPEDYHPLWGGQSRYANFGTLYYSDKTAVTLSTSPLENRGAALEFRTNSVGQQAYYYDTLKGSLLLEILIPVGSFGTGLSGPAVTSIGNAPGIASLFLGVGKSVGQIYDGGLYVRFDTVPEPHTWALMLLGSGVAGSMLRRRWNGTRGARALVAAG